MRQVGALKAKGLFEIWNKMFTGKTKIRIWDIIYKNNYLEIIIFDI